MTSHRIISVDDHIVEPPSLWQERLPTRYCEVGPRVERQVLSNAKRLLAGEASSDDTDSTEVDVWRYEDLAWPMTRAYAHSGYPESDGLSGITYDEMMPAAYDQTARIKVLDESHTESSLTFPTFPRFCGQTFLEAADKELALLCVQAYNDWMVGDWCSGDGYGRLIPLTLVPLWDADLAAAEVRRTAELGGHAICFSEQPVALGQPSIHSGYWEPLWRACDETETVVNMHIGSSSRLPTTSPDAPIEVLLSVNTVNSVMALCDWVLSGVLERHRGLKIALSEGQVGWIPYYATRMDQIWEANLYNRSQSWLPRRPSEYVSEQVYGCIFDDPVGLRNRDLVGMSQIMIETDFPHTDSTYPESMTLIDKIVDEAGLNEHETWQLVRGNAIECYGLHRWGIAE
jgi:predicted TIM-barrel fold metal-dependent hydrolase